MKRGLAICISVLLPVADLAQSRSNGIPMAQTAENHAAPRVAVSH